LTWDPNAVQKQAVNFAQVNKILEKAYRNLRSAIEVDNPDSKFTLAYETMLQTSLALMLSYGFRPRQQLGHHRTLVEFAKKVLGQKFFNLTANYDKMRRKRNKLVYDIDSVSKTEALEATKIANKYFEIVENKIQFDNPQQKLWKP